MERDDILRTFHEAVSTWFCTQFPTLTEAQRLALPSIKKGENVLLLSPTGSGKTLAGFLGSIDYLVNLAEKEQLENTVYVVYVSPLRALSNDIKKNLVIPLEGIRQHAPFADIQVLVRTGDTSAYKKSKMLRKTPHILITTPETLQIVLNAPKFREKLTTVKYVIVDEIHDLCDSKRGVSLSLSLERLQNLAGPFVRIGLSATQAPVEEIAQFLGGTNSSVRVLIAEKEKKYDLHLIKPQSLSSLSLEKAVEETYDILKELIESHNVTLVFSNTRSRTERIVYQLKNRGVFSVAAHHGSMGKETRHHIEHLLKEGQIKSVITSTSLELGIDIGDVDLVVQLGSPKQTAKLMQRVGRAGHGFNAVSKGVLIAQDRDELVELEVLKKKALAYELEPVQIPQDCLDVLAQHLVGMSLEKVWECEEAFRLVRQSYNYRNLSYQDFVQVLEYLGGYYADLEEKNIYRKVWFDGRRFGKVKGTRHLYFSNCGTIPSEATFLVTLNGIPVGTLSEQFVSHLKQGDVFVLGGRSLEFVKVEGMRVIVKDALGGEPTVPSWRGEAMSRSYEFAHDLSQFRRKVEREMEKPENAQGIDPDIVSYFEEQKKVAGFIPTDDNLYLERYIDGKNEYHFIFHFPFGRRVNETLARVYSYTLKCSDFTVTDNGFMLNSPSALPITRDVANSREVCDILKAATWGTELFYQRFRHCSQRGFLTLKNYKGKSVSPRTQYFRARSLLKELPFDFPMVKETFREVLYSALDAEHAAEVLEKIEKGEITVVVSDYKTIPSPFALSILLAGAQDVITLRDRSEFLQHMQRQVAERIVEANPAFDAEVLEQYYKDRERELTEGPVREVILDVLRCGVKTAEEIASELTIGKEEIEKVLDNLIEENLVSCGYFTSPELQYMLVKDRRYLEYGEGIEEERMRKFVVKKHFTHRTVKEVFSSYGFIRSKRALYDRVGFFSHHFLKVKIGGRLVYILPEDGALFVSAYRGELLKGDTKTLHFIREHPGLKRREIIEACGSDVSQLEEALYVYRDEENRFYVLDTEVFDRQKARKEIVHKYVASCGPVSREEILYHTRFQREELDDLVDDFRKVTLFSRIVQEMYCTSEDYEGLQSEVSTSGVRIIDHTDPFYDKVQYEVASLFGESFSPVMREGELVGGILFGGNAAFSVEDFVSKGSISAQELFREIERVYQFYRWHGARTIGLNCESLRDMARTLGYSVEEGKLIDAPRFERTAEDVHMTQVKHQFLFKPTSAEKALRLPFLDAEAAQKRTTTCVKELLEKKEVVEVLYNGRKCVCLSEDGKIYEENDIYELIKRLMHSFLILSPFQIKTLVHAELYEVENVLSSISKRVYYQGEIHYAIESEFISPEEPYIQLLSVTDPYVVLHNEKWLLEGTAILINGMPAGYYIVDNGLADLTLFKEYKDYWGMILVKLPSENVSIRTINGRSVKDTRFARAFS